MQGLGWGPQGRPHTDDSSTADGQPSPACPVPPGRRQRLGSGGGRGKVLVSGDRARVGAGQEERKERKPQRPSHSTPLPGPRSGGQHCSGAKADALQPGGRETQRLRPRAPGHQACAALWVQRDSTSDQQPDRAGACRPRRKQGEGAAWDLLGSCGNRWHPLSSGLCKLQQRFNEFLTRNCIWQESARVPVLIIHHF